MAWESIVDPTGDLILSVSVDKTYIVGIYPVLYGFRVRAGLLGELSYDCDWCCGTSIETMELSFNFIVKWLEEGKLLSDLPMTSQIKPFYNDTDFMQKLAEKNDGLDYSKHVMIRIDEHVLNSEKTKYLSKLWDK